MKAVPNCPIPTHQNSENGQASVRPLRFSSSASPTFTDSPTQMDFGNPGSKIPMSGKPEREITARRLTILIQVGGQEFLSNRGGVLRGEQLGQLLLHGIALQIQTL